MEKNEIKYFTDSQIIEGQIESLELLEKKFSIKANNVFIPGCGNDISASKFFSKNTKLTFLDPVENNRKIFDSISNGRFIAKKAEEFESEEEFDLVISSRVQTSADPQIKNLKSGGHVLVEQKMVDTFFNNSKIKLIGVVDKFPSFSQRILKIIGLNKTTEELPLKINTKNINKYYEEEKKESPFMNNRKNNAKYFIFKKL